MLKRRGAGVAVSPPRKLRLREGADLGGVLVRPAEHAASTYTKPELPDEAKQNTESGAELAAEHYLAILSYAWNTGDVQSLASLSTEGLTFAALRI